MDRKGKIKETLENLLKEIKMSETYSEKILAAWDRWEKGVDLSEDIDVSAYARAEIEKEDILNNNEMMIMLFLVMILEERAYGAWKRFPEEVYLDTISDFTSFVKFYKEATGEEGYGKSNWPIHYANARVFRLGELEYELEETEGKREVAMHIPEGAHLTPDAVADSLKKEKAFMREYFPEWADLPHTCESWMLSPVLKEMLPETSRILWFQSLFDIQKFDPEVRLYLQFLFRLEYFQWYDGIDLHTLKEDTSLQRNMKKYVLSGGKPGAAYGVLKV